MKTPWCCVMVMAACCVSALPAQTPAQGGVTFRTSTRLMVETVTVKDNNGRAIEDLTADDFALTENGVPQPISFVEFQRFDELLPGKYAIKLLIRDAETGRMGTYQTSFVIPNLEKESEQLRVSSLILSSQRVRLADSV
jgi:hypothetical protein